MQSLERLLRKSAMFHSHLCSRQVLGVRIGLAGMNALGFTEPPLKKRLFVTSETDGCFVDGLATATGCMIGHRTLRVEDYGKVAAAFARIDTGHTVRVATALNVRERAFAYAPGESRHYFAQMQAYQVMPDEELLSIQEVTLNASVEQIMSRPGIRVDCSVCGEEIMNEREILRSGLPLCLACAGEGYYQPALVYPFQISTFSLKERDT